MYLAHLSKSNLFALYCKTLHEFETFFKRIYSNEVRVILPRPLIQLIRDKGKYEILIVIDNRMSIQMMGGKTVNVFFYR